MNWTNVLGGGGTLDHTTDKRIRSVYGVPPDKPPDGARQTAQRNNSESIVSVICSGPNAAPICNAPHGQLRMLMSCDS